jgi:hypothetical protein
MENEQEIVAAILKSMPPPDVPPGFAAKVRARIDETAGWFGLADFRVWTLRLAPAAAALTLVAVFWSPAQATHTGSASAASATSAQSFSPASSSDWQRDVSGEALLEAALTPGGGGNVR